MSTAHALVRVWIRRVDDGVTRESTMDGKPWTIPVDEFGHNPFWWSDGNASCDCNREAFFLQSGGESHGDGSADLGECSDGRYRVRIEAMDGTVIYDEMQEGK